MYAKLQIIHDDQDNGESSAPTIPFLPMLVCGEEFPLAIVAERLVIRGRLLLHVALRCFHV
jgi:hypothetical protein